MFDDVCCCCAASPHASHRVTRMDHLLNVVAAASSLPPLSLSRLSPTLLLNLHVWSARGNNSGFATIPLGRRTLAKFIRDYCQVECPHLARCCATCVTDTHSFCVVPHDIAGPIWVAFHNHACAALGGIRAPIFCSPLQRLLCELYRHANAGLAVPAHQSLRCGN